MKRRKQGAVHFLRARRRAALGVVGVTVGALVATAASSAADDFGGSGEELTLFAETTDAGALIVGNDVRMYGVKIGVIDDLEVVDNARARLTLALTTTQTPIHQDATLRIRPVSLLGERYIELTPGSPGAPVVDDGDTLPAEQVSRAVDLDEVLDAVDEPTGEALSMLLTTLGQGLAGNGENTSDAIASLAPSMEQADKLVAVLEDQTSTLQQLVDSFSPVAAALAVNQGGTTDALFDSAAELLNATADERSALEATLEELPATLRTAEGTLDRLSTLSDETIPALRSVQPFTSQLEQVADEAGAFATAAQPAIESIRPVLVEARKLVDQATPLVSQLAGSSDAMFANAANGSRFLLDLTDRLDGLLDFITYWSLTTNGEDGLSHYFRVQLINHPDTVTSLDPTGTLPVDPLQPGALGDLDVPVLPGLLDAVPSVPDVLGSLPGLGGGKGGLGGSGTSGGLGGLFNWRAADAQDSATGLSISQEEALFSMLTGGAS
ncbi:MlaD family protein [Nocardioides sp.]|uniref:MlaD family protein n=1 Tax=Nocardioides sp. TaxID=35761 RepID=UPI0035135A02